MLTPLNHYSTSNSTRRFTVRVVHCISTSVKNRYWSEIGSTSVHAVQNSHTALRYAWNSKLTFRAGLCRCRHSVGLLPSGSCYHDSELLRPRYRKVSIPILPGSCYRKACAIFYSKLNAINPIRAGTGNVAAAHTVTPRFAVANLVHIPCSQITHTLPCACVRMSP